MLTAAIESKKLEHEFSANLPGRQHMTRSLPWPPGVRHACPLASLMGTSRLLLAALILLAAQGAPALADTAESETATGTLEEVVISAEKRESTVQETPISITAITGADLESKSISTVEDLVAEVPGVSIRTAGPGQTEYEIRGLTSSGGSAATVGFYLDETPLSASAVALNGRTVIDPDLFDLNHVEVLRGPQGTLYGAGSMGGTIKLVTNQPNPAGFDSAVAVDGSHTDGAEAPNGGVDGMLNIPLGDAAAVRVVATEKFTAGWIDRIVIPTDEFPRASNIYPAETPYGLCSYYFCTRGDVADAPVSKVIHDSNNERFTSARGTVLVKPVDALSITATFFYQRIDADGYNNFQSPPGNLNGTGPEAIYQPYDLAEPYYDSFKLGNLTMTYDFGDFAQLTSVTAYWKRFVFQSTDSTEALQNIFNTTNYIENLYVEEDPTAQLSQELRLTSKGTGPFQWVVGGYTADLHSGYITYNQEPGFATAVSCPYPTPPTTLLSGQCPVAQQFNPNSGGQSANPTGIVFNDNNPNVTKQYAFFGEASYKLTPALKVTAGVRYFRFTVANTSDQAGLGTGTGNASAQTGTASGNGSAVLPKINVAYEPTPDLNLYATVDKGARPGGVNLPIPLTPGAIYYCGPGSGPSFVSEQPAYYRADSVTSFELGEKARLADQRFSVNADVFYIKWTDIQQIISLSCGYPYDTNAGQARSYGPELELAMRVTPYLTLGASGTWTQAYISDPAAVLSAAGFSPGTAILTVPKYSGQFNLDYSQPLANGMKGVLSISDAQTGPEQDQAYYRETLPAHNILDARIGVMKDQWSAYFVGTNLTNTHAALTIDNTTFAWQQPTITRVSTNQPLTVGVRAMYHF
jgi:outer membrane receptor protein involved in Fe transport